jgi:hypothetical protein
MPVLLLLIIVLLGNCANGDEIVVRVGVAAPNELAEILLQIADKVHVFRNEKTKR